MSALPGRVWRIGCGNMGGAMLRRWIDTGALAPSDVTVITRTRRPLPEGVAHATDAASAGPPPDTMMLAIKPQQLDGVASMLPVPSLLISILAGVDEAALAARIAAPSIVRAMPNLPVGIGEGVVALHGGAAAAGARDAAARLMAPLGLVEWIADETLFDAVTALSGCGPGFVFRFVDALAEAGVALGLPGDQAGRLALATVAGAAAMAMRDEASPAMLADRVASPGGSTREGLNVLDRDAALADLLRRTLRASADRNAAMAAAAR